MRELSLIVFFGLIFLSYSVLDVQTAVPIIMGANIGTSVTNTLVSFGQVSHQLSKLVS